jgi:hypothetical protein
MYPGGRLGNSRVSYLTGLTTSYYVVRMAGGLGSPSSIECGPNSTPQQVLLISPCPGPWSRLAVDGFLGSLAARLLLQGTPSMFYLIVYQGPCPLCGDSYALISRVPDTLIAGIRTCWDLQRLENAVATSDAHLQSIIALAGTDLNNPPRLAAEVCVTVDCCW